MIIQLTLVMATTLISSLLLTKIARRVAIKYHIGDDPSPRKVHNVFVPYLGGVAILLSVIIGVVLSTILLPIVAGEVSNEYFILGVGCTLITLVGLYDDIKKLKFSTKFYFQILAAIIVILSGFRFESLYIPLIGEVSLGIFSPLFIIFWIVFITNAINLLDGLDGLASGVSIIIFVIFAIISFHSGRTLVALVNILFIMAILGFLKYNIHPASIFMGDTGSLFIGFSMAIISLEVGRIDHTKCLYILTPVTVMAVPLLDTVISFFRRAGKHTHPFMADKEHIHHRLMSIGFTHPNAVKVMCILSIGAALMGLSYLWLDERGILTVFLIGIIISSLLIRRLGYVEIEKNLVLVGNSVNGNGQKKFIPFDTSQFTQTFLFSILDVTAIACSFFIIFLLYRNQYYANYDAISYYDIGLWIVWSVIYWIFLLGVNDLYHIEWDVSRIDVIFDVIKVVVFGTLVLFLLTFRIDFPFIVSRRVLLLYALILPTILCIERVVLITYLKNKELLGFRKRPTLIAGASERALNTVRRIRSVPVLKFDLKGFVDNNANGNIGKNLIGLPILGGYEDLPDLIKSKKIKEVIIALDDSDEDEVINLLALCSRYNASVKLAPDFYNLLSGFRTSHIYGVPLIKFFDSNMKTWEWLLKRLIDMAISLVVLIGFLPFWIVTSTIIVLDSRGPIFYKQKRVGKDKLEFDVIKFRSMIENAEELTGPKWAEADDPRVTKFGRFLRKTGLDEVPQFINVLVGDMSIVGPRPERPYFVRNLENTIQFYSRRLIVKPGITGWAQIKHKYDETIDDVREKLRYDLYYIENMSMLLDLKIIVQTLLVGLRKRYKTTNSQ
jgi:exopolysaccharide biosynthesis polyprenyl glycosylphosphotransferase